MEVKMDTTRIYAFYRFGDSQRLSGNPLSKTTMDEHVLYGNRPEWKDSPYVSFARSYEGSLYWIANSIRSCAFGNGTFKNWLSVQNEAGHKFYAINPNSGAHRGTWHDPAVECKTKKARERAAMTREVLLEGSVEAESCETMKLILKPRKEWEPVDGRDHDFGLVLDDGIDSFNLYVHPGSDLFEVITDLIRNDRWI
jgi:hypothetical protein